MKFNIFNAVSSNVIRTFKIVLPSFCALWISFGVAECIRVLFSDVTMQAVYNV